MKKIRSAEASKTNRLLGGLLIFAALALSANSLFAAVTDISQLDNACVFSFAAYSDSRGETDQNAGRALGWIQSKHDFALAVGDLFDGISSVDNAFINKWKNESFWHNNHYPCFGNHCSKIGGHNQYEWGTPYYTLTNLNTSGWVFRTPGTEKVKGYADKTDEANNKITYFDDRKIDYYVKRTFGNFNVHIISVYSQDHAAFFYKSANFLYDKIVSLDSGKTDHDLIIVQGHHEKWLYEAYRRSFAGYGPPLTEAKVKYISEVADIVLAASDHKFRRLKEFDAWGNASSRSLHVDTGQVYNTEDADGYCEFHVFEGTPPKVTCQYINADITTRKLHVGVANDGKVPVKDGYTSTSLYPMMKRISGTWVQPLDWNTFDPGGGTPPQASCHIDVPTGNVTVSPGASLLVKVSASDPDGVERVKLFSGATELISDSSAPYELTLSNLTASFTLTAKVKDLLGNYTDSDNSRTITVSGGTTTTVPWVTNLTVAAAGTSITNAGLVVGSVSQEHHATVPAGKIFSQTPGGGTTVNRGTAVNLAESLGPSSATTVTFYSVGVHDGYVDESSETSNVGGTNSATLTTGTGLRVGDTGARKQRKSIVSFDTSTLPDTAVVTAATLKLKRGGGIGTPTGLGVLTVDIKNVSVGFGTSLNLENMDFEYAASKSDVGTLNYPATTNAWAIAALNTNGTARIAKTNHTQFRIRFATDDDNDSADDYLGFYSGENASSTNRPILEVTYQ